MAPVTHDAAWADTRASKEDVEYSTNEPIDDEVEPIVTPKTWVVVFILSMGYGLSFWPIPIMATIQSEIAASFETPNKYIWFIPAWTIAITVCFMLCGANTDLLGRRWFLVGGNLICTVGHIVVASATSANNVIAGMGNAPFSPSFAPPRPLELTMFSALAGFGGANCQMAAFALSELLPNKWRHIGVVLADTATFISVIVAPVTARFGWQTGTWRWNFYAAAIAQFLSFVGLYLLYYPPAHPYNIPFRQIIREIDYMGGLLFVAGALPVLMGIVWTTVFPSNDPHVIAPLCIGFFFLVLFALWETYGNLKHPLTPSYVFTSSHGRDLTAPCIALAVVNMFYYSSSIIWPTMIYVFYTNGGTDWRYAIVLSITQGLAISFGAVLLGIFGSKIRHWQWQLTGSVFVMVLFGSLLALGTPDNKGLMVAFVFLSQSGYGWAIYLSIAVSQMGVDHKDLGLSGGISGVARFAAGSIAAAVYTTILSNTVAKWTAQLVLSAATGAGLPASDVPKLLAIVGTPALAKNYSPSVVAAVGKAVQLAYQHGMQMVAYASMAFGIIGIIACACCKDVDSKMNNKIEVYLENTELANRNKYH